MICTFKYVSLSVEYNALHVSSTIPETVRSPTRYKKERLRKDSPKIKIRVKLFLFS